MSPITPEEQLHIIKSGIDTLVPESLLLEKLERGKDSTSSSASIPRLPISISAMRSRCASYASSRTSAIA